MRNDHGSAERGVWYGCGIRRAKGGIFIWVTLPDAVDTTLLAEKPGSGALR